MKFDISGRGLTTLESVDFPEGVTKLYCYNNRLQSLEHCPSGVTKLVCSGNQLQSLEHCPPGVTKLYCDYNLLQSLEHCPQGVTQLVCYNNQLQSLEHCPPGVTRLWCYNNQLKSPWNSLQNNLFSLHTYNRKLRAAKWVDVLIMDHFRLPRHLKIEITDRYLHTLSSKIMDDLNIIKP